MTLCHILSVWRGWKIHISMNIDHRKLSFIYNLDWKMLTTTLIKAFNCMHHN